VNVTGVFDKLWNQIEEKESHLETILLQEASAMVEKERESEIGKLRDDIDNDNEDTGWYAKKRLPMLSGK
jgi:hypothetical protein